MPSLARRSRLAATLLAVLALASSAPAAGAVAVPSPSSVAPAASSPSSIAAAVSPRTFEPAPKPALPGATVRPPSEPPTVAPSRAAAAPPIRPAPTEAAKSAPRAPATTSPGSAKPTTKPSAPRPAVYHGTNRMWMPALGSNHSVASFPCSRTTPPGLGVYRSGCAGANNVYLLAHAYAAFKPLHDAYVRGRLRIGMKVMYADASGRVRTYAISWWRLTTPDKGGFAYAAQSRPSMTLQTCVGARSEYRLIVRLTEVG